VQALLAVTFAIAKVTANKACTASYQNTHRLHIIPADEFGNVVGCKATRAHGVGLDLRN